VREVEERRNPRTKATVGQLLDRYLDQLDAAPRTKELYRGYVQKHIAPLLGGMKASAVDAEVLDSFYAELRRCRDHCAGRARTQHRTAGRHACDQRCRFHECNPLSATTVRHMHFILSGAYKRAVRWKWVAANPCSQAEPPAAPTPNPRPPTADEAARIVTAAWRDVDWGTLVWVAMTTGARRGELCALRWTHVDLSPGREVLWLYRALSHGEAGWIEGELKTHQQRRVALDPATVAVLAEHRERCAARCSALGAQLDNDAFVFSPDPDGSRFLAPPSLTQRYERLAARLGIATTFHKLRHYSATELITAGVDVRTVAGRLGHGGGGTTTLKAYAAWVSEADQRAAKNIGASMPERPRERDAIERAKTEPRSPYERIAAQLREEILAGEREVGRQLPPAKQLASEHDVALSTVRRAVGLLETWGVVAMDRGRRLVLPLDALVDDEAAGRDVAAAPTDVESVTQSTTAKLWAITLRGPDGTRYPPRHVSADISEPDVLRPHLLSIARLEAPDSADAGTGWIGDFELEVREVGREDELPMLTLRWQQEAQ